MFSVIDMAKTLSQRVLQILEDQNISQVELAKAACVTRRRVNQWIKENRPDATMSPRYAFRLAERFGYEARWVMTGDGPVISITAMNHRVRDLLQYYARCDERGKAAVLSVAEREAAYNKDE